MLRKRHASSSPLHESSCTSNVSEDVEYNGGKKRDKKRTYYANANLFRSLLLITVAYVAYRYLSSSWSNREDDPPPAHKVKLQTKPDQCGCYSHDGTGARIAYLLTLHNKRTLDDSLALMKAISAPGNIVLIHMDVKMQMKEYEMSELKDFIEGDCQACNANVLIERKFDIKWGQWSMNDPTHWSKFYTTRSVQCSMSVFMFLGCCDIIDQCLEYSYDT